MFSDSCGFHTEFIATPPVGLNESNFGISIGQLTLEGAMLPLTLRGVATPTHNEVWPRNIQTIIDRKSTHTEGGVGLMETPLVVSGQ